MAISHFQPLLLLLLVSLFFFPTLGVYFRNCAVPIYPIQVNAVEISPVKNDRIIKFTLNVNTSQVIYDYGPTIEIDIMSTTDTSLSQDSSYYALCRVTTCPIKPGPFMLSFSVLIPTEIYKSRSALARISIGENSEVSDVNKQLMCIRVNFTMDQLSATG